MPVFLIDPTSESVSDVEQAIVRSISEDGDRMIDAVRSTIDAKQVAMLGLGGGRLVLFVDNYGLLRGQQSFWRMSDGQQKIGGKALLMAVSDEGFIVPLGPGITSESVAGSIVWERGVTLLRLHEDIAGGVSGQMPQIVRIPVFSDDPNPAILAQFDAIRGNDDTQASPQPHLSGPDSGLGAGPLVGAQEREAGAVWTVTARPDGSVRALRYTVDGDEVDLTGEVLTAADLPALRLLLPPGCNRVEPYDDDPPDVIEVWVEPEERRVN